MIPIRIFADVFARSLDAAIDRVDHVRSRFVMAGSNALTFVLASSEGQCQTGARHKHTGHAAPSLFYFDRFAGATAQQSGISTAAANNRLRCMSFYAVSVSFSTRIPPRRRRRVAAVGLDLHRYSKSSGNRWRSACSKVLTTAAMPSRTLVSAISKLCPSPRPRPGRATPLGTAKPHSRATTTGQPQRTRLPPPSTCIVPHL